MDIVDWISVGSAVVGVTLLATPWRLFSRPWSQQRTGVVDTGAHVLDDTADKDDEIPYVSQCHRRGPVPRRP